MTKIKTALMLATLPLTVTALLAGTALADRGDALVCGADDDRSLVCFYDASTSPDALTLERCDDADSRRPVCASVELDLTAPDPAASLIWPWDQCSLDDSWPGSFTITCFGVEILRCTDVPFSGWSCN